MKKHDCISKERAEIMKESPSVTYVRFDCATIKTFSGGSEIEDQDEKTGQRIWIGYKKKNKQGVEVQKETKTFITHKFCPFCGKKYN